MARQCYSARLTRAEVAIVATTALFLTAILPLACRKARTEAAQTRCAQNLALLGKAMLVYAGDYDGELPRTGGRNTTWGQPVNWTAEDHYLAFNVTPGSGDGGRATIGSCLYLLVKYAGVTPSTFLCPDDPAATEFKLAGLPDVPADFTLTDAWDFGPDPGRHYSYAYHMPFGRYALTTSRDPGLAVLADRNPWIQGRPFEQFKPDVSPCDGPAEQATAGNTTAHQETGQNVLFLDGHVQFKDRPHCALDNDNIYTTSDEPERGCPAGQRPRLGLADPRNARDSVLVHEPAPQVIPQTKQPQHIDANSLKQTTVLPTLDCPLPTARNAIWCASFQMAWDEFKNEAVGEPTKVLGAEELADRLNGAEFPRTDIEDESYYAVFGSVDGGILETIQDEMARRFPSATPPVFDDRYRTLELVTVAYAYLTVDMNFKHPFRTNERPFAFTGSDGTRTAVTSFSCLDKPRVEDDKAREQVEILHYEHGDSPDKDTFAVDLCKHTQPYQVVLACMPLSGTLRETLAAIEKAIDQFKDNPDYETLRQLRRTDQLIVPDVLYELTHHFTELEDKYLGNRHWQDARIFDARQMIDFSLSRTGVVLKSTGVFATTRSRRTVKDPRHLHFNRPFLIYVKKRQPHAQPFFVMWVDNAELLKPYDASPLNRRPLSFSPEIAVTAGRAGAS